MSFGHGSEGMSSIIRHEGVIDSIEDGCVHVRILQDSACASCKVAGYCNALEAKEKLVDVYVDSTEDMKTGQPVTVAAEGKVAAKALLWAFAIPLLLMLTVLILTLLQTGDEGLAATGALLSLIPYYGILYLTRHRMRRQIAFYIEK